MANEGKADVRGLAWLGIQTGRFDEMHAFMQVLLGGAPSIEKPGFGLWSLPNGDIVELYAPGGKPAFWTAPVVGFQVADLEAAKRDILAAGAEIVGGYGPNEAGYATVHFRAPDGNIYEITFDPDHETRASG
jgi:catechol 2,3-dioxygenase-like lactoylglutathione lyase family enzyme